MKTVIVAGFLVAASFVDCNAADRMPETENGPILLASGKGYTIHHFKGIAQGHDLYSRVVNPGVVVFHTDINTGRATWMIRTGTFENPTVRISFGISRLLGIFETHTQIATVTYVSGRTYDRPIPLPDQGDYRLTVFAKESGQQQFDTHLDMAAGRLKQMPDETIDLGVIQRTSGGFSVFGTSFFVDADGHITKKGL